MKILLIQLSDIHINDIDDGIFQKIDSLANSIVNISYEIEAIFFTVTGDIANYGFETQYDAAELFFEELFNKVKKMIDIPLHFVAVPGNHDCDLKNNSADQDIRKGLLSIIPKEIKEIKYNDGKIDACVRVQNSFFKFISRIDKNSELEGAARLFYQRAYKVGNFSVRFDCFNTSWMSVIHEIQGSLFFPVQIAASETETADVVLGLFHHPFNWLEANNAREFRLHLEKTVDFILTGHEHIDEHFLKRNAAGAEMRYLAGDVLQEDRLSSISGFNVILVDFENQRLKISNYKWEESKSIYRERKIKNYFSQDTWYPFRRNLSRISKGFFNSLEFSEWLDEIGTLFIHPFKSHELKLSDLFVYPNFKVLSSTKGKVDKIIRSDDLIFEILNEKFCLIFGEEHCGKTTFAKKLYIELQQKDKIPFYLDLSSGIKNPDEDSFRKLIESQFSNQYPNSNSSEFWQLPPDERVIIIDNFQHIGLNISATWKLLLLWKRMFGKVYVFADTLFQMQFFLVSEIDLSKEEQLGYSFFEILPANRFVRGRIIKNWTRLGRESQLEEREFLKEEQERERILNPFFDRRIFPSHPFWVISVLQLSSPSQLGNQSTGASYGYIHNELITKQLRQTGYPPDEIGKIYTALGIIAYTLYKKEVTFFDITDFSEIGRSYYDFYGTTLDREDLGKLVQAKIFKVESGKYKFTYPYLFYFFVANFFAERFNAGLGTAEQQSEILGMIQTIAYQPHYQIILFFIHFTKSHPYCEQIIVETSQIYNDKDMCQLNSTDVEFFNRKGFLTPKYELPAPDTNHNREKYREMMDAEDNAETEIDSIVVSKNGKPIRYNKDLDDLTKLTIALRSIELLGEILRNFWGSLGNSLKMGITLESYSLGLRIMNVLISLANEHSSEFINHYILLLKKENPLRSEIEIQQESQGLLIWMVNKSIFGLIRKIAMSVGHRQLGNIYREVRKNLGNTIAIKLIDLSIKLEFDGDIGTLYEEIANLKKELKGDVFNLAILREIIWLHLYLHPVGERERQRIQELFDIKNATSLITNQDKLLTK